MNSREAFEAHIKSLIESEAGEAQALARGPDDDYTTAWVRHQWYGWQAAIQHASDVAVKACEDTEQERANTGIREAFNDACQCCADAIKEALK